MKESFIIIGASYGIATFLDVKTKTLLNLARFESIENIRVTWHSQMLIRIDLDLFDSNSLNNEIVHKVCFLRLILLKLSETQKLILASVFRLYRSGF